MSYIITIAPLVVAPSFDQNVLERDLYTSETYTKNKDYKKLTELSRREDGLCELVCNSILINDYLDKGPDPGKLQEDF